MNKTKLFLTLPIVAGLVLTSCGGDSKTTDSTEEVSALKDSGATEESEPVFDAMSYSVPSPGEMLAFIKQAGGKENKNVSFLNPPANYNNYIDAKAKALNFGIYVCDLSYCSMFEIGMEALKYIKTVKQVGDQIGVSSAIKPDVLKRLERNLDNSDSLTVITDDIYFSSFDKLEKGRQGATLSLVVAGSWVESMFIASNLFTYEANSPTIERFADQKYALDNLVEFLTKHEADKSVAEILVQFKALKAEFDKIGEKNADTSKPKTDKKILDGGSELVLTAQQYKTLVENIKTIRNSFTSLK